LVKRGATVSSANFGAGVEILGAEVGLSAQAGSTIARARITKDSEMINHARLNVKCIDISLKMFITHIMFRDYEIVFNLR
jgi:hypothetical protein